MTDKTKPRVELPEAVAWIDADDIADQAQGCMATANKYHQIGTRYDTALYTADQMRAYAQALATRAAAEGGEAVAWRVPTPYGVGYSFASDEMMRDMADWLAPATPSEPTDSGAVVGWIDEQDAERLRNKGPGFVSCQVEVWPTATPDVRRQTETVRLVPISLATAVAAGAGGKK